MSELPPRVRDMFAARPDIAAAFDSLAFDVGIDPAKDLLGYIRAAMASLGSPNREVGADVVVLPMNAGTVAGEFLVPPDPRADRRLVHLHGGAWIAGSTRTARRMAETMARESGCAVFVPDYRLAPESRYPAALDDALEVVDWVACHGPHGAGEAEIGLSGDSAGGNLAAAVCVALIHRGKPLPRRLGLISAILDAHGQLREAVHDPISSAASVQMAFTYYAVGRIDASDATASPLLASDQVLAAFPNTLIQASSFEYLLGDAVEMARRMANVDLRATLSLWPAMPHAWHYFVDDLPEADAALREMARFLAS